MKIGILTFHNADNYGAVLQCYALQEFLKKQYLNDEVFVIDYRNPLIDKFYKPLRLRGTIIKNITQFFHLPQVLRSRRRFKQFRKKYFNLGTADFSKYDVIYYGSDQIWNPDITGGDLIYFGKGFSGKKIAYAASDGGELQLSNEIRYLLNTFSEISCREKSLSEFLINNGISVPIKTSCDPVFLISKNKWQEIALSPKQNDYILAFMMASREDFDNSVEILGKKINKSIIHIVYIKALKKLIYKKQKYIECISPEQFVGYIANADTVFTTSFHATAFSIIFEKKLYVLSFEKRSARITDLLKEHNLESCYIDGIV